MSVSPKNRKDSLQNDPSIEDQEIFRNVFLHAKDGICIIQNSLIKFANTQIARMLGYDLETALNTAFQAYILPAELPRFLQIQERFVSETGFEGFYETVLITKGGNKLDVELNISTTEFESAKAALVIIRDISNRKRAAEALRLSEERFRTLYENSTIGLYRTTPEGKILLTNPALIEMLGYDSFEELSSRNLETNGFEPNYPRERFKQMMEEEGEVRGLEFAWKRKDGKTLYIRESARAVKNETGDTVYYEGTVEDITTRVMAEAKIEESERKYRLLTDNSTDVIFSVDLDLKITYMSPSVVNLTGYTVEEIKTMDYSELLTPASFQKLLEINQYWQEVQRNNAGQKYVQVAEFELIGKDKTIIWVEINANPIWNPQGKIESITGSGRDITKRKKAQEALKRSEAILHAVSYAAEHFLRREFKYIDFESVLKTLGKATGVCRISIFENYTDDDGQTAIQLFNNWVDEKYLAASDRSLISGLSYKNAHIQRWLETFQRFEPVYGRAEEFPGEEGEILKPDEILSIAAIPVLLDDELWGFMEFDDCSVGRKWSETEINALKAAANAIGAALLKRWSEDKRRRLEERMKISQKSESLGILAGGIAHDFNNLLQSVMGYSSLLELEVLERVQSEYVEQIKEAVIKASKLTQQMLAYSGKSSFQLEMIDISDFIVKEQRMIEADISSRTMVKYTLKSGLSLIEADVSQLKQAIINLVTNAYEALENQAGTITITTGESHYSKEELSVLTTGEELAEGTYVFFEVKDNGKGMDQEILSKIFDPFFSTKFAGRGLGMAAVLGIVKGLKGGIKVDTQLNTGTAVRIVFPVKERKTVGENEVDSSVKLYKRKSTVLIIESEDNIRNVTKRMIERLGFKTIIASDINKAREIINSEKENLSLVLVNSVLIKDFLREFLSEISVRKQQMKLVISICDPEEAVLYAGWENNVILLKKPYRFSELSEICAGLE